jgi:hypothetical protein
MASRTMNNRRGRNGARRAGKTAAAAARRPRTDKQADGRARGKAAGLNAQYERYTALARTAAAAGDVIEAENCHQHAEHYFRQMNIPQA